MQINSIYPQYEKKYVGINSTPRIKFNSSCDEFVLQKEKNINFKGSIISDFFKRLRVSNTMKDDAGFHCYLAGYMKRYFDFEYGTKNYTVISIGRSMASLVETLGKKNRDTVCLPLSNLSNGLPENIKYIDVYRDFLKSKGLTKEIIEKNPHRHYILVDNSITGDSLNNAKEFLSREDLLGNPNRLEIASAENIFSNKYYELRLDMLFNSAHFQKYSPIGWLDINDLSLAFKQGDYKTCEEYSEKKALKQKELFDFVVQDKINKANKKRNR